MSAKTLTEVLASMPFITDRLYDHEIESLAGLLTAAGIGNMREASNRVGMRYAELNQMIRDELQAKALEDAADALDGLWDLRKVRMGECRDWADGVEESETLVRDRAATLRATK